VQYKFTLYLLTYPISSVPAPLHPSTFLHHPYPICLHPHAQPSHPVTFIPLTSSPFLQDYCNFRSYFHGFTTVTAVFTLFISPYSKLLQSRSNHTKTISVIELWHLIGLWPTFLKQLISSVGLSNTKWIGSSSSKWRLRSDIMCHNFISLVASETLLVFSWCMPSCLHTRLQCLFS